MKLKKIKKILITTFIASSFSITACIQGYAAQTLYNDRQTEHVIKGVTYEMNHRLTDDGWQDIYVLRIDMTNHNVKVEPIESKKEYGLKETVSQLAADNGAVAGVNASFFGMTGKYSASFGMTMKDGNLASVGTDLNIDGGSYATLFINDQNNPFIQYVKTDLQFTADGVSYFDISSVNKVTDMVYPMYFDRNAAVDTAQLDARFPNLAKIIVENDVVVRVSEKGETVTVPENGYLIVISENTYDYNVQNFRPGQAAKFTVTNSINLENIQAAISGAGKILENGQAAVNKGYFVKNRQPRTAVGVNQGGTELILVAVDGRGTSIGATPDEMAALMQDYGAYEAMHLDGGGSTTMVVKTSEEDAASVKNVVSEGTERKVINGIGVIDQSPVGEMTELVMKPSAERVFSGSNVTFEVFGYDEYYHKLPVPMEAVTFTSSDPESNLNGNVLMAANTGTITVTAEYNGFLAEASIESMDFAALEPSAASVSAEIGDQVSLSFTGMSPDGYAGAVSGVVLSSDLGTFENGVFTATKEGSGYIKCQAKGAVCYVKLFVGGVSQPVTSFENIGNISFSGYPTPGVKGAAAVTKNAYDGNLGLTLNYTFAESTETQAAYLNFDDPIKIPGKPTSVSLMIKGNGSGAWIRGKIKDAGGQTAVIDFTKNMNWTDWQDAAAAIPSGLSYPITLETLYVAALSNTNTAEQSVSFDSLRAKIPNEGAIDLPEGTKLTDSHQAPISGKEEGSVYINMVGDITFDSETVPRSAEYDTHRSAVNTALINNTDLAVYGGKSDIDVQNPIDTVKWNRGYQFYNKNGVSIVQMSVWNGTLWNTNPTQWLTFKQSVQNAGNQTVIFMMDKTPSAFSDQLEAQLFRKILGELKAEGKTIFVVSSSGYAPWNTVKEGVSYINLPNLWYETGNLNKNFKLLTFKITDGTVQFDLKNIFQ